MSNHVKFDHEFRHSFISLTLSLCLSGLAKTHWRRVAVCHYLRVYSTGHTFQVFFGSGGFAGDFCWSWFSVWSMVCWIPEPAALAPAWKNLCAQWPHSRNSSICNRNLCINHDMQELVAPLWRTYVDMAEKSWLYWDKIHTAITLLVALTAPRVGRQRHQGTGRWLIMMTNIVVHQFIIITYVLFTILAYQGASKNTSNNIGDSCKQVVVGIKTCSWIPAIRSMLSEIACEWIMQLIASTKTRNSSVHGVEPSSLKV